MSEQTRRTNKLKEYSVLELYKDKIKHRICQASQQKIRSQRFGRFNFLAGKSRKIF